MDSTISEMKNTLEVIKREENEADEQISQVEDRDVEITAKGKKKKKKKRLKRTEQSQMDLWDNIKCTDICILWVLEGEEREKGPEKMLERDYSPKLP